ncbi:MAG TPA: helix-turn-helix transcriptional regulator, partial [Bacillota bacterium]|nr:helix-turn-helix transcriptional regulator [Bacillota bacterium]
NKTAFWIASLLPLLLLMILSIVVNNQNLIIFPADDLGNRIWALADNVWQGNSQIDEFAYDNKTLKLRYRLKKGYSEPKVFFSISLAPAEKPVDLSDFDSVSLHFKEATPKRFFIFIKTFLPGISQFDPQQAVTLRHNQYILQLKPNCRHYTIKLKDFITPSWWTQMVKLQRELLPPETFCKAVAFDLHFLRVSSDYRLNKPEKIVIDRISFHRKPSFFCYLILAMALIYVGWLVKALISWRRSKNQPLFLQGKNLTVTSYREKELSQVKEFIEANYGSAEISTRMVAEQLGLSPARVIELLKDEYQLTFKQLINKLRITEAKRLLKDTDLPIIEIAFNLGFNNASYFNKLFKQYEDMTPSEYREKA